MTRLAVLRAGYAAIGLAFAAMAATLVVPSLLLAGVALAVLGGLLLAISDDDLPKWAGAALLTYVVVTLAAFIASTPVTVRLDFFKGFLNAEPSAAARATFEYLGLALPIMLCGCAIAAAWEREAAPRVLLFGAIGGFFLVAILTVALVPRGIDADAAADVARSQGDLLRVLFAVSAGVGATGALWAASRPDSV